MKMKEFEGLIKEMVDFLNGKNPENLRVFKVDKEGNCKEVINAESMELIRE